MWAKVYFWIIVSLFLYENYYLYIVQGAQFGPISTVKLLANITLLSALFSFVFKRELLKQKVWRNLIWFLAVFLIFEVFTVFDQGSIYTGFGLQDIIITLIGMFLLSGPSYYALFRLAGFRGV